MNSPRDLPTRLSIVAIGIALGCGNLLAWDAVESWWNESALEPVREQSGG